MAKNLEMSVLMDFYADVLTDKQKDIMEQYYYEDLSLAEIGENFSITRQGVRDAIKRSESVLLEMEEKVGFAQRYRAVQDGMAQIEQLAKDIMFYNSTNYNSVDEIGINAERILDIITRVTD